MSKTDQWPDNCVWPKPVSENEINGEFWEADDVDLMAVDDDTAELLGIREYYDGLVEEGRLNEDYSLNEEFDVDDPEDDEDWEPEKGLDYWDGGFDVEGWEYEFSAHINLLKLPFPNPVDDIRQVIGYEFVNENLLRQAFTRRAFGIRYNVGNSEQLEFIGDAALEIAITREMTQQFSDVDTVRTDGPFVSKYDEGDFTKIRSRFICKEYLSERAMQLGLDRFILYGTGEEPTDSSREDMMEALIGAVALDSDWNWDVIGDVIDRLICLQLSNADDFLKSTYYDLFNAWHQRHFGVMPDYEITAGGGKYYCALRFSVPDNDKGIRTAQRVDVDDAGRSRAREYAARCAYGFVVNNGLWINLAEAGITPSMENSINQLQELYQKKYIDKPVYEFEEREGDMWHCLCVCNGLDGMGNGHNKTEAKKKAAYMALIRIYRAAGICRKEWE